MAKRKEKTLGRTKLWVGTPVTKLSKATSEI